VELPVVPVYALTGSGEDVAAGLVKRQLLSGAMFFQVRRRKILAFKKTTQLYNEVSTPLSCFRVHEL
jgi:hypothetical protein